MFIKESKPVPSRTLLTSPPTAGLPILPPMTNLSIGRAQVNQLHLDASIGKAKAVKDLVELASYATHTVQSFWEENDPTFAQGRANKKRIRLRELIKKAARDRDDFPVLHSWRKNRNRVVRAMLAALPLAEASIWKTSKVDQDKAGTGMHHLILDEIYPRFQWLRRSPLKLTGLNGKIQALPNLRLATRRRWAQIAAEYCASPMYAGMRILRDPNTWLHKIAKPKRQLDKRIAKAKKRLQNRFSGVLDPIEATRKMVREQQISRMVITEADHLAGLTEAISARLKSILKK